MEKAPMCILTRESGQALSHSEDHAGQATCDGGLHLLLIGLLWASPARRIQNFVRYGIRRDVMLNLNSATPSMGT
jgi:hypothetical protein